MKKTHIIILALILVGGAVFYFTSNYSRTNGKAAIIYPNKEEKMTQILVWGPAGKYYIEFGITPKFEDIPAKIGGKGMVQFGAFGSTRWRNNYMHRSELDLGKTNQMLENMEPETPYLMWQYTYKKGVDHSRHYIMITKHPELYKDDKALMKLAEKAIKPQ